MGEVKAGVFTSDEKRRTVDGTPAWLWVQARMVGGTDWAGSSAGIMAEIKAYQVPFEYHELENAEAERTLN